jgi:hypothetical protein
MNENKPFLEIALSSFYLRWLKGVTAALSDLLSLLIARCFFLNKLNFLM